MKQLPPEIAAELDKVLLNSYIFPPIAEDEFTAEMLAARYGTSVRRICRIIDQLVEKKVLEYSGKRTGIRQSVDTWKFTAKKKK